MSLDVGSAYQAAFTVTDANGAPENATTIALTITQPDQTQVIASVANPPALTGLYTYTFVPVQAGLHKFDWQATGPTLRKVNYETFRNYASAVSLDDARDRIGQKSTASDERLRTFMAAATREVEKIVGVIVPRTFTDWIPGTYHDAIRVPHGPILTETSVTALASAYPGGPSWDMTQLIVNPNPGIIRHRGLIPFWYGPWKCSYTAGMAEPPEPVTEAVKEVVWDLWSQMRGLTADIAEAAAAENLMVPPYYRLPARALAFCKGYELPTFG